MEHVYLKLQRFQLQNFLKIDYFRLNLIDWLTHFVVLICYDTPCFQGVSKEISDIKLVKKVILEKEV